MQESSVADIAVLVLHIFEEEDPLLGVAAVVLVSSRGRKGGDKVSWTEEDSDMRYPRSVSEIPVQNSFQGLC